MKIRYLSICFLLLLFACSKKDALPIEGTLTGKVFNTIDKQPIQGAKINLKQSNNNQAISSTNTDSNGGFTFDKLSANNYTLEITANGYEFVEEKVTVKAGENNAVSIYLRPVGAILNVSNQSINFDNAPTQALNITNKGQGNLEWNVIENIEWLKINPMSGKGSASLALTAFPQGLKAGKYSDSFVIVSNGGSQRIDVSFTVKDLTIPNSPYLKVSNVFLPLTSSNSTTITIQNEGQGDLFWSVLAQVPWLNVSQLSGKGNSTITFSYNNNPLPVGTYSHIASIQSNGGTANILVSLQIGTSPIGINTQNLSLITLFASNLLENSATLNGVVNTKGTETTISFEYGTTSNLGNEIPALPALVRSSGDNAVVANLTTLQTNTTYFARLKAQNTNGTFYGNTVTFRTPAPNLSKFDKDLFAYFPFDNTINDYTKNFKPTMKNLTTGGSGREIYVDGVNGKGKALDFSGDYSYIEFDKCKDIGNVFTFSFFVKTSVEDRNRGNKLYRSVFSITRPDWKILDVTVISQVTPREGQLLFFSNTLNKKGQSDFSSFYSSISIDNNSYRHIIITGDGGLLRFYVDGQPYGAEEYQCQYTSGTQPNTCLGCFDGTYKMTIGLDIASRHPFVGAIDEFRIYQRAFSADEVKELFESYK